MMSDYSMHLTALSYRVSAQFVLHQDLSALLHTHIACTFVLEGQGWHGDVQSETR